MKSGQAHMLIAEKEKSLSFLHQQILSSRNVLAHPIIGFWYGGLNYQIEHHLLPAIPRNNLNKAQQLIKAFYQEHEASYHEAGSLQSYRKIFQHLNRVSASLQGEN